MKTWIRENLPAAVVLTLVAFVICGRVAIADSWVGSFLRDNSRQLNISIHDANSGAAVWTTNGASDNISVNALGVFTAGEQYAYNGSGYDRLRTVTGINSSFTNQELATGICDASNNLPSACANVRQGTGDGVGGGVNGLQTESNLFGYNGTSWDRLATAPTTSDAVAVAGKGALQIFSANYAFNGTNWDRLRSQYGVLTVTPAGKIRNKISNDGTTCTSVFTGPGMLTTVVAAGAETATAQIYDEGASPTCAATDLVYNKIPPNGASDPVNLQLVSGMAVKFSAAPAVNDYVTLSQ